MIYIANWKMNQGFEQAQTFLQTFKTLIKSKEEKQNFVFLPPAFLAGLFSKDEFYWGAQNIHTALKGSFTGENSLQTATEMGAQFCLLGHSERRYGFGESEAEIEKKFHCIQELGLIPILCVGESEHERENKDQVFKKQLGWLKTYMKYKNLPWKTDIRPEPFKDVPFIVAYEPVWSIGTGLIPEESELEESCQLIRKHLHLKNTKILYGGSVDKSNVKNLAQQTSVDGFLVGGASLKAEDFYSLYTEAKEDF